MDKKDDRKTYDRLNKSERALYDLFSKNPGVKFQRKNLRNYLDATDQTMRDSLRTIKQVMPICNFQDGEGYWLSENIKEVKRMYNQELHRLKELKKSIFVLETFLKDKGAM